VRSLGVSGDGGVPLRLGLRDGQTSASTETPVALEACLGLGLAGVVGLGADSQVSRQRPLGLCVAKQSGLVPLVPRTWGMRQALEGWGQQHAPFPL
jgi:hypothetical protein